MPKGTGLKGKAAEMWQEVYDSCIEDGDDEETAAKKAWGAVKQAGLAMSAYTLPEALELRFATTGKHQMDAKSKVRWHPVLPVKHFEQAGVDIDVTEDMLNQMVANLKSGIIGPRRPVTIAHPKLSEAPAKSWFLTDHARVGTYKDTKALYVGIEWMAETEDQIRHKDWGFISPVFHTNYTDQTGKEIGPVLLALGLTNDPHWTSQEELWTAFARSIGDAAQAADKQPARSHEGERNMVEMQAKLDLANGKVTELTAASTAKDAEIEQLKKKLVDAENKVHEFTAKVDLDKQTVVALTAKVEALEKASHDKLVRDAVEQAVVERRIDPAQRVAFTALAEKDLAQFAAIVATMSPKGSNTVPRGVGMPDDSVDGMTVEQKALAFTRSALDKNPKLSFAKTYADAEKQIIAGVAADKIQL